MRRALEKLRRLREKEERVVNSLAMLMAQRIARILPTVRRFLEFAREFGDQVQASNVAIKHVCYRHNDKLDIVIETIGNVERIKILREGRNINVIVYHEEKPSRLINVCKVICSYPFSEKTYLPILEALLSANDIAELATIIRQELISNRLQLPCNIANYFAVADFAEALNDAMRCSYGARSSIPAGSRVQALVQALSEEVGR